MIRVLAFGTLFMMILYGCSKENSPVEPFHRDYLHAPVNVEATWENNSITVKWETVDSAEIISQFMVSMSDSSGLLYEQYIPNDGGNTYVESSSYADSAEMDSVWYYFRIREVDVNLFKGPESEADSVLVP